MTMQPIVGNRPLTLCKDKIQGLKDAWVNDPCWDIEDSEGFYNHREELLDFRKKQEQIWDMESNQPLQAKAEKLGVPGNVVLAKYISILEQRLLELENKLMGD